MALYLEIQYAIFDTSFVISSFLYLDTHTTLSESLYHISYVSLF